MEGPIYLVGAAGIPNYGDDLIMSLWLEWLADRRPDTRVWVDCPEPGRAAALMADRHPRVQFVDTLWELTRRGPESSADDMREYVADRISHLGTPELDRGLMIARESESIHLVGGGYINRLWRKNLGLVAAAAHLSRSFGVQAFGTGLGLSPQDPADVAGLRSDLGEFNVVSVRDAESADLLGVSVEPDDIFLNPYRALSDEIDDRQINVLVQGDFVRHLDRAKILDVIDAHVSRSEERGSRGVRFLEAYPQHDSALWGDLRDRYPDADFMPFDHLWRHGLPVGPDQSWLTSRFHFHLLAAVGGARGAAIVLDDTYYATKHASLIRAGTGWTLVPLTHSAIAVPEWEPSMNEDFTATVAELRQQKRALADRLYPAAEPPIPNTEAASPMRQLARALGGSRVRRWIFGTGRPTPAPLAD